MHTYFQMSYVLQIILKTLKQRYSDNKMSFKSKNAFKMMLSWKQTCNIFDNHFNIFSFLDQFYKEMLIFVLRYW